jgi:hypothetical protein
MHHAKGRGVEPKNVVLGEGCKSDGVYWVVGRCFVRLDCVGKVR